MGFEDLHRQGWWIPILRVRSSVLEVCESPSLGFGDLHLQSGEIPFLVAGGIPNLGVRWILPCVLWSSTPEASASSPSELGVYRHLWDTGIFFLGFGGESSSLGLADTSGVGRPQSLKVLHLQGWAISIHVCPWREDLCPPSWMKPQPTSSSVPQRPHCSGALGSV